MHRAASGSIARLCVVGVALIAILAMTQEAEGGEPVASNGSAAIIIGRLAKRGLLSGSGEGGLFASVPSPPAGVDVNEYLETAADTGEEIARSSNWDEKFGDDSLRVQVSRSHSWSNGVFYWIRRRNKPGCILFGINEYDRKGQLLRSRLWRSDQEQRPFRGPEYPPSLFPNAAEGGMPYDAFLYALTSPTVSASGVAYTQITPYQVVALNVWVAGVERVQVPAGEFSALKVVMRTDIRSFGIPGLVAALVEPFLPKNIMYYQAEPPHREIKFEGVSDQNAPRVVAELTRYYTAHAGRDSLTGDAKVSSR